MEKKYKVIFSIFCIIIFVIIFYGIADKAYRKRNIEEYSDIMNYYGECLKQEKDWIMGQQGGQGTICLYESEDKEKGSVVPYFSCQAALGLLSGEVNEEELEVVADYLSWHTKEIIKSDGLVCDYHVIDGKLESTDEYDSVDSYIALYLTVLATFYEKGGNPDDISQVEEAVEVCVKTLKTLTDNGLTKVSDTKDVYYLMDNLEVLEACEKMDSLLNSKNKAVMSWKNKDVFSEYFSRMKKESKDAIKSVLWNEKEQRFEVGVDGKSKIIKFKGMDELYPYAISQVYSIACDLQIIDDETEMELFNKLSQKHEWVTLKLDTTFEWPVLSYIAFKLGDIQSAEEYLKNYRNKYYTDRGYPFKTPDAGWAARTYAELHRYYEEKINRSLMDGIFEKLNTIRER